MRKENISRYTIIVNADIFDVWHAITDHEEWQWRSDLKDINTEDNDTYIEYKKNSDVVNLEVVRTILQDEYVVKFHSSSCKGLWKCNFFGERNGATRLEITQSVIMKNPIKNLFANTFLKIEEGNKQFENDLKNKFVRERRNDTTFNKLELA